MVPIKFDIKPMLVVGGLCCAVLGWVAIELIIWAFNNISITFS